MKVENFIAFTIGIVVGVILFLLARYWLNKGKLYNDKYDERQRLIRAEAGKHSFWLLAILTFFNGWLLEIVKPWADYLWMSVILFLIVGAYYIIELMIKGAYFGLDFNRSRARAFVLGGVCWAIIVAMYLVNFLLDNTHFISAAGKLTSPAVQLFIYLWLTIVYIAVAIIWYRNSKK